MHARRAAGGAGEGIDVDASKAVYLPRGMDGICVEDVASSQAAVEELPSEAYRIVDVTGCDQKIRHLTRQYHVRILPEAIARKLPDGKLAPTVAVLIRFRNSFEVPDWYSLIRQPTDELIADLCFGPLAPARDDIQVRCSIGEPLDDDPVRRPTSQTVGRSERYRFEYGRLDRGHQVHWEWKWR